MAANRSIKTYDSGSIVYFHHLHVDKVTQRSEDADDEGNYHCAVEGKARRMLILGKCLKLRLDTAVETNRKSGKNECVWYEVKARLGYWVLSLTSKCPPGRETEHWDLGVGVIERGQKTFVNINPVCYPAEIVCHREGQRVGKLDKPRWEYVEKMVMFTPCGGFPT